MVNLGHETERIEFKKTTGEINEAIIDIVAILNKHGEGTLYFGVAPSGDVKGQQVSESTLRDVSRKVFENIKPQIFPQIEKVTVDGKDIIQVNFSGKEKPYSACGRYYIRIADESRELTPAELRKIMLLGELSENWEQYLTEYTIADIDEKALRLFYDRAVACGRMPNEQYNAEILLSKLGLLKNGRLNNAGYVLFGNNNPITLKMAVFATDEKLTFIDIVKEENNIFNLTDIAMQYIKKNIRWRAEIKGLTRIEIPEIPVDAIREIVVNSFAHAKYGSNTQHEIDIHPSKVVVYNPGEFPSELSPEDFATRNLSSIIRNEIISRVLYLCHDVETFGSGFRRVYSLCSEAEVKCSYEKTPYGFSFIFNRKTILLSNQIVEQKKDEEISLSTTEMEVLKIIEENISITQVEIAQKAGKTKRTIERAIVGLKEKGLLERAGANKNGYWVVKKIN